MWSDGSWIRGFYDRTTIDEQDFEDRALLDDGRAKYEAAAAIRDVVRDARAIVREARAIVREAERARRLAERPDPAPPWAQGTRARDRDRR